MKSTKLLSLAAFALAFSSANAAVITDFSSFTESGNLIGNPPVPSSTNTIQQSFTATTTSTTNSINIDYVSGSNAGQEVYLSDAFSLATVGRTLIVDFGGRPSAVQQHLDPLRLVSLSQAPRLTQRVKTCSFGVIVETLILAPFLRAELFSM